MGFTNPISSVQLAPGSTVALDGSVTLDDASKPPSAAAIGAAVPVPPSAAAIGAAVPVPPSAGSIGAAVGAAVPVPPSAAAIGAAVPSAAAIGAATGAAVPVPPSAAAIGAAVPVPPSAAAIGAAVPVPPSAAAIAAGIQAAPPTVGLAAGAQVAIPAASTGSTPVSGSSFAVREASATATAVATVSRTVQRTAGGGYVPIVTPGAGQKVELHNMDTFQGWYTSPGTVVTPPTGISIHIQRADTSADLITPILLNNPSNAANATTYSPVNSKDFQGVTLPAGVAINLVLQDNGTGVTGSTGTETATVDLNYSLVT